MGEDTSGSIRVDRILINDLTVRCIIGVREEERRKKQEVLINIILYTDLKKAGEEDNIAGTVDYKVIKDKVREFAEKSDFKLVEALAHGIARICLEDGKVLRVRVRVEKPGALTFARSAGVEITREIERT